ncbi:hypothetical protein AGLY_016785 [Aphis glycines]|uniref:Uncharacterized protein n=1 Tax=Aphis glycines TaxID=307491 RepID=A0A6G0SWS4_APHGL|nr:hypothetical protein AGLY_016785 [Aphis glycines]
MYYYSYAYNCIRKKNKFYNYVTGFYMNVMCDMLLILLHVIFKITSCIFRIFLKLKTWISMLKMPLITSMNFMNLPYSLILFRNHINYNTNYSILNKILHIDLYGIQFIASNIITYRDHYLSSYKHQSLIDTIIFINYLHSSYTRYAREECNGYFEDPFVSNFFHEGALNKWSLWVKMKNLSLNHLCQMI